MHILKTRVCDRDKAAELVRKLLHSPDSTPKMWSKKDEYSHTYACAHSPPTPCRVLPYTSRTEKFSSSWGLRIQLP